MEAKDLGLTNAFLYRCILDGGDKEWKSRKDFLDCVEENSKDMQWRIIGWVSYRTLWKWNMEEGVNRGWFRGEEYQAKYYLLCKGNRYWFVRSFLY